MPRTWGGHVLRICTGWFELKTKIEKKCVSCIFFSSSNSNLQTMNAVIYSSRSPVRLDCWIIRSFSMQFRQKKSIRFKLHLSITELELNAFHMFDSDKKEAKTVWNVISSPIYSRYNNGHLMDKLVANRDTTWSAYL